MICQKCGTSYEGNFCPKGCNSPYSKPKKPIYKKWWFWVIIAVVTIGIGGSMGGGDIDADNLPSMNNGGTQPIGETSSVSADVQTYESVDLQTMIDELSENALKAEKTYQDKYIEVTGKISNFDSDGKYISIEPVSADMWNFDTVMCYIENEAQLEFLLEKTEGDTVVIKGQVTSVGEVLGYSIDIDEIS